MIDVVCYCGCAYSFTGAVGSCPQCGEHVFLGRESESQVREETIATIVARASSGSPPGELAA
jgi:hypothetical protein